MPPSTEPPEAFRGNAASVLVVWPVLKLPQRLYTRITICVVLCVRKCIFLRQSPVCCICTDNNKKILPEQPQSVPLELFVTEVVSYYLVPLRAPEWFLSAAVILLRWRGCRPQQEISCGVVISQMSRTTAASRVLLVARMATTPGGESQCCAQEHGQTSALWWCHICLNAFITGEDL